MENIVKVHVNMGDVVAAGEHLHMLNDKARHKYHTLLDWYTFITKMIKHGVENKHEMSSSAGLMLLFEWIDDTNCHVDVFVKAQFDNINYVTFNAE